MDIRAGIITIILLALLFALIFLRVGIRSIQSARKLTFYRLRQQRMVMVNDDWHERLSPEDAARFIDEVRAGGAKAFTGCHLHKEKGEA